MKRRHERNHYDVDNDVGIILKGNRHVGDLRHRTSINNIPFKPTTENVK